MAKGLLHITTFGCQMNENDSLKIVSLMESAGYELTHDPGEADCIILNTCSIREKPEQKVYSALGRLKALKRKNPDLVIGVGGCVAQQRGKRLLEKVPHLDFVFGTHHIDQVPEMVGSVRRNRERSCADSFSGDVPSLHYCPRPSPGQVKAFVTIMQGCDNFCSYCVVPYVRGREQSRAPEEIVREAEVLGASGVREITLLGQNVNSYGKDNPTYPSFPDLLRRLQDVDGVRRIRFTTSHPKDLSTQLMEAMAELPKVCEHLHLPLQSGSSKVLRLMNRRYDRYEYLEKVYKIRAMIPGIALTTDVIVGFPGETDEDFEGTLSILEEVKYDGIYSFKFSARPMTHAAELRDSVPEAIKSERLRRVQTLQNRITASILERCVGSVEEVLVEGPSARGIDQLTGRTRTHRIVHFEGDEMKYKGKLVLIEIQRGLQHTLFGRIVRREGEV